MSHHLKHGILLVTLESLLLATPSAAQSGWFWQSPVPQGNDLNSVSALDANTVIAVGDVGTVIKTMDGGRTWVVQTNAGGMTNRLFGVSFVDANTGTAVGAIGLWGTILRTTDGGAAWNSQSSEARLPLYGVSFVDVNMGTAVGGGYDLQCDFVLAIILRTGNGGGTWTEQTSGTTVPLTGVSFVDANTGTAVGGDFDFAGGHNVILRTINGGATWAPQSSGTTNPLYSVSFTDAVTGTAVGQYGTILRTNTGGETAELLSYSRSAGRKR